MRYLTLTEVLDLHDRIMRQSGGATGLRDLGLLEAAIASPRRSFDDGDLYVTLGEKVTALGFAIIQNHPFLDGNKRVGHAAIETMLMLNGFQLKATVDDSESIILAVASGRADRTVLLNWIETHLVPLGS